jgi:hypothetical protein
MSDIRYQFVATGANAVLRDWQSLTAAAQKYAAEINKLHKAEGIVLYGSGGGAARAGAPMARRGGGGAGAEATRAARDAERNRAYLAKIRDKYFADEQRAEERAAAKKIRTEEQALARIERMRAAARAKEIRETERAEKLRVAQTEKARIAEAKRSAMARDGMAGSVFRGVGGVAMGLAAAGIGVSVQATRDAMRVQELANRVSINARKSGQDFLDPNVLRKEWEKTAQQSPGQTAEGVGNAVQKFIAMTGDIDTARTGQGVFATVASATGADIGDVAETAASIATHFDIKGLEEMRDVLASLTFQGKEGAFELKDAAAYMQGMAASAAAFGVQKGAQGIKTLGGLAQIARTTNGSGAEAATSVERMFTQLKTGAAGLKKSTGIDIYKDGKTRDITELLPEIIAKMGGSDMMKKQTGLQQLFDVKGFQAVSPLVTKYNEVYRNTKGADGKPATEAERMKAAMAAVTAEIDKNINAAGTWNDVQKDAARAQQNSSAKLAAAWEKVVAMAGEEIVPALIPLVGEFAGLTGVIKPAIEAIGLFIRGLGSVVDFLRKVHILDGPTDQEKNDEAKAKLEAYQSALPEGPMGPHSPAVEAKLKELRLGVEATNPFKAAGTNLESFTGFGQFRGALEKDGLLSSGNAEEQAQAVKSLYTSILSDPKEQMDLLKSDPSYMSDTLTDEGRKTALSLASQTKDAEAGQATAPAANLYEAEKLVPAFAGLGTAAAQLQKVLEAAANTKQADLLGGGPS